ncbi:MAG: glycosyl hydrolase family 65 protein, partial [Vagococcus sp.]
VNQYVEATGDKEFLETKGYEIILDTAKFWSSRLEWSEEDSNYQITDVIGPDEYKEHVDNNAFTNYTAKWNIQKAIHIYEELKENNVEKFNELNTKLDLDRVYADWLDRVDKIFIPAPNEDGIIPQDDTYLSKKIIDLVPYKEDEQVGTLFHEYNLEQVNDMQVTKQADVLLLIYLFENLFSKEIKLDNWNYYEPKTMHDSSLSLSTHSALAADLGELDLSYQLFKEAIHIDMGPHMTSSDEGIHAASLGGIWQMIVFGYGGVRVLDGQLRIEPHLPENWDNLVFSIFWHGTELKVTVTKEAFEVEVISGEKEVTFDHKGEQYSVTDKQVIKLI